MPGQDHKHWKDLCQAALDAQDSNEMLKILLELDRVLEREEEMRRQSQRSGYFKKSTEQC